MDCKGIQRVRDWNLEGEPCRHLEDLGFQSITFCLFSVILFGGGNILLLHFVGGSSSSDVALSFCRSVFVLFSFVFFFVSGGRFHPPFLSNENRSICYAVCSELV